MRPMRRVLCLWKHGFCQAISCCLHLGLLSTASSMEARTTTLGIGSCSCYKGGEQHGQHWAETYPGGVVINHGYNTLYNIYIYVINHAYILHINTYIYIHHMETYGITPSYPHERGDNMGQQRSAG